jgi:hypothetical protein
VVARLVRRVLRQPAPASEPEPFPGSPLYWEQRYASGGTSGPGSYGVLAQFKADVLNGFVDRHRVATVTELGCGDGNQLSLARYPAYRGLDVAASAIDQCSERFAGDPTKSFYLFDPQRFHDRAGLFRSDLALSLDVVFHLVEDEQFKRYMTLLFDCASRFAGVYSSNSTDPDIGEHVRHRRFTDWVETHRPSWTLVENVVNPHRGTETGAVSDFWFYAAPDVAAPTVSSS